MIARGDVAPNRDGAEPLSVGRNFTKARVSAVDWRGAPAVVKSVEHQPAWLRWAAGTRALDREERAYRLLAGVRGVPSLLERPDRWSLVLQRVAGRRLDEHPRHSLPPALFDALARVLRDAHERGVAHGDLHRKDVIVDAQGRPWVLDWATSLVRRGSAGVVRGMLYRRWIEVDERAVEKLRRRYALAAGPGADQLPPAWALHRWIWRMKRLSAEYSEKDRLGAAGARQEEFRASNRSRLWGRMRLAAMYTLAGVLVAMARPTPFWLAAGLVFLVPGEALRWWAAGHLLKSKELVTSGPYAYTQNPLYLGRLLILTGLALMCRTPAGLNWIALGLGLAGFFGYYLPRKLRVEGARLESRHGERWRAYGAGVPILFPAWRRFPGAESGPWSWARMVRNREYLMVLGLAAIVWFLYSRLPG